VLRKIVGGLAFVAYGSWIVAYGAMSAVGGLVRDFIEDLTE